MLIARRRLNFLRGFWRRAIFEVRLPYYHQRTIMAISIKGLDKAEVLRALWEAMLPAAFFRMSGAPVPGWETPSPDVLEGYIDYYNGRCIKADLTGDSFDPRPFDRDSPVKAALVIAGLRGAAGGAGGDAVRLTEPVPRTVTVC